MVKLNEIQPLIMLLVSLVLSLMNAVRKAFNKERCVSNAGAVCLVCFTTLVSAVSGFIDLLEKLSST